jgi:hypothetical protein
MAWRRTDGSARRRSFRDCQEEATISVLPRRGELHDPDRKRQSLLSCRRINFEREDGSAPNSLA